jgi:hypothetical protein
MNVLCEIGGPELWAEKGGIIGLVLLALFVMLGLFIRLSSKKDTRHENFIQKLIEDDREERKEARDDNGKVFDRLGGAIDSLTDQLKKGDK